MMPRLSQNVAVRVIMNTEREKGTFEFEPMFIYIYKYIF